MARRAPLARLVRGGVGGTGATGATGTAGISSGGLKWSGLVGGSLARQHGDPGPESLITSTSVLYPAPPGPLTTLSVNLLNSFVSGQVTFALRKRTGGVGSEHTIGTVTFLASESGVKTAVLTESVITGDTIGFQSQPTFLQGGQSITQYLADGGNDTSGPSEITPPEFRPFFQAPVSPQKYLFADQIAITAIDYLLPGGLRANWTLAIDLFVDGAAVPGMGFVINGPVGPDDNGIAFSVPPPIIPAGTPIDVRIQASNNGTDADRGWSPITATLRYV